MRKVKSRRYISKIHFIILGLSIVSMLFLFIEIPYISIFLSFVFLICSFVFSKDHRIIFVFTIIISLVSLIIGVLLIFNVISFKPDVYKDKNFLVGSWLYNDSGGRYVFYDDKTYIQYVNSNNADNYCKGKYVYKYGVTEEGHVTIRQDENYYYYTLTLNEEHCLIKEKKFYDNYTKIMYVGIRKDDEKKITMLNKENKNMLELIKQDN